MPQFSDVQHGQRRFFHKSEQEDQGSYLPTQAEIRRKCEKFRSTWSKKTLAERCAYPVDPVTVARSYESNLGKSGVCRKGYNVEGKS